MNTSPLTTLRELGKPVLAGLLVVLLFVSALASADPALHRRLHADHQTPSHYCLVTLLDHGQTEALGVWTTANPIPGSVAPSAVTVTTSFVSQDTTLFPERGPPCLF